MRGYLPTATNRLRGGISPLLYGYGQGIVTAHGGIGESLWLRTGYYYRPRKDRGMSIAMEPQYKSVGRPTLMHEPMSTLPTYELSPYENFSFSDHKDKSAGKENLVA